MNDFLSLYSPYSFLLQVPKQCLNAKILER